MDQTLSTDLAQNEALIRAEFGASSDLSMRRLSSGPARRPEILVAYLKSMADRRLVDQVVMAKVSSVQTAAALPETWFDQLRYGLIAASAVYEAKTVYELLDALASGDTVVLVDGQERALVCASQGFDSRTPDEPSSEPAIRGPKEGFVESLITNVSLIRRRIRHPSLRVEQFTLGRRSRTRVCLVYIDAIAQDGLVVEARSRLSRIDVDAIASSQSLEELITDQAFTPFPTMLRTERPDRAVAGLLEGRVCFIVEGTPDVLLAPVTFPMLLTSAEDYYDSYYVASAIRLLRWLAFAISLLLPGIYVAVTTFHQELLPTPLIIAIAAQREGVPFPAMVEVLLMEGLFEILREAGLRLPKLVGPAVSIIGALVLGDAAIRAGLVSPAMVIVVAATGVASFTAPIYSLASATRLLRFIVIFLASSMGLYGVVMAVSALLLHLISLRSFGTPYLGPWAPLSVSDLEDSLVRAPSWANLRRPAMPPSKDPTRKAPGLRPSPPHGRK